MSELPSIGTHFCKRYRLDAIAGEGGFGTVYRAEDTTTGRTVAVKLLHPDREDSYDPRTRARFEREARILDQLRSPHTVVMYDHGISDSGLLYMVLEWLDGIDLSTCLRQRGRLEPGEVVQILRQLLDSLDEAHRRGLLHRDIKPDNVRLIENRAEGPVVKLLDFGLARATDDGGPAVTATGEVVGTPRYMAPEQILGGKLTSASDIYSLGVVALELLMGEDALPGNRWGEQFERLLSGHVFSMPELERIGPRLTAVIQRMTARDASDRFQTVEAVRRALDGGEDVPQHTVSPPPPRRDLDEPSTPAEVGLASAPRRWVAAAILCLGMFVAVTTVVLQSDEPATPAPRSVVENAEEERANPLAPPAMEDSRSAKLDAGGWATTGTCTAPFRGVGRLRAQFADHGRLTYIPAHYGKRGGNPLLVFLQEVGSSAESVMEQSRMRAMADEHGYVVIAPFDQFFTPRGAADLEEVRRSIDLAVDQLCVDESRIFVVGHGGTGHLAERLSCELTLAGSAAFAYGIPRVRQFCDDEPIPHLLLAPTDSRWEPLDGENCHGVALLSLTEVTQRWRQRNGCGGEPTRQSPARTIDCRRWQCEGDLMVCEVAGGRPWPRVAKGLRDPQGCDGPPGETPLFPLIFDFFDSLEPRPAPDAGRVDDAG